jgi:hypothetical protein
MVVMLIVDLPSSWNLVNVAYGGVVAKTLHIGLAYFIGDLSATSIHLK